MPRQSGSSVVTLLSGSVKVEPTSPSNTDGAGLPDVPLSVQPCVWAAENSSVVLSGWVIVPTRSAESYVIVVIFVGSPADEGSVTLVIWPDV